MKIKQLSTFIENRPGQLLKPVKALADAGISILTLSLADTREFGIVHLIVHNWQRGREVLQAEGLVVNVTEVVAVEVDDKPGGLSDMLAIIERGGVNIEYMYAFTFGCDRRAVLVFRFENPDQAIEVLRAGGVNVMDTVTLTERST
ncbi:MAG: amino acid-binding protein [Candidatus Hydrogenedentes bacterium]|nr:amino acid-binding protein [Candidatus Hydrogenedentota bacterium]